MPTGQVIITNALITLGINEQGAVPSASDSVDALAELNAMWQAWGIDEGLIFAQASITKALTANVGSYTIGIGGAFNTALPSRIYKAFITSAGNRNEIEIVNAEKYYSHNDLAAAAVTPDEVYPDFNVDPTTGFASVKLWPVQTGAPTLELLIGAAFGTWALATNYILPEGFQDAINYALAWRLIPRFGEIIPPSVAQVIAAEGAKAEQRIRVMNERNRILSPGAGQVPATPPAPPRGA